MPNIVDLISCQSGHVRPEATLGEVAALMLSERLSSVIVVDAEGVRGIATEGDILHAMRERRGLEQSISAVMTSPVETVAASTEFRQAYRAAARQGMRHIVVTDAAGQALGAASEADFRRHLGPDFFRHLNNVDTLMERMFPRLPPEALLDAALAAMESARASCAVVVEGGKPVGILTERDVVRLFLKVEDNPPLGTVMTQPAVTLTEDRSLADAAALMDEHHIRHLVVVSATGHAVGLLSEHILMRPLELGLFDEALAERLAISRLHDRAQEKIARNEDYQRALLDNFPFPVWLKDTESRFLAVNRALAEASGETSAAALVGKTDFDFSPPELAQRYRIDDLSVMASRQKKVLVEPFVNQQHLAWLETYKAPMLDDDGTLLGTVGFAHDITERRRAEEADILRNAALAGLLRDEPLAGALELVALAVETELPGWTCAILLADADGQHLRHLAGPRLPEAFCTATACLPVREGAGACGSAAFLRRRVVTEEMATHPYWAAYRDAVREAGFSTCWSEPIFSAQGHLLGGFAVYHRQPLTPSGEQEAVLTLSCQWAKLIFSHHQDTENLQKSLETFRGIFDSVSEALFIQAEDGTFLDANLGAERLFGYSRAELVGLKPAVLAAPGQKRAVSAGACFKLAMAGVPQYFEYGCRHANGSTFPVDVRVHPCTYFGRRATIASVVDISERKQAEESQKLAASVFDNAHEGIMITDPQGRIVEVNGTFSELTGYERAEVLGQTVDLLKSGHHDEGFFREMWQTISAAGYWRGEVWNRKKSGEVFVELLTISAVRDPQGAVSHFVSIFSDITLLKKHQERLEHLAHFDALTQLPNRMLLGDRMQLALSQSERNGKMLAVCYLDLDGFKPVNDQYGHAVGDRLLVEVAQRLRACIRAGDTVSRLGGDEFVLLFSDLEHERECDHAIGRIISALTAPFHLSGYDISISASIGVTLYPQDGADSDTLLRHADQAMYAAKQAGRNRFHLFDPENDRRARMRHDEIGRIRQALADGEFQLYYQPKVDMRQGCVVGAEALIRWVHPVRGLLLPDAFLLQIKDRELSAAIGDWVLQEALRQLARWQTQGLDISLSVNISGDHLQIGGFARRLGELLAAQPAISPRRLELEVRETAALEDIVGVAEIFTECRRLGVSFSLDDFGAGYSSLTHFRRLPVDALKIDQSFVCDMLNDPDDLAIVEGVIGLTRAFQRKVIAEGVETVEHSLVLLLLGCDVVQGFGIAPPMPAEQLPEWIQHFVPEALWNSATAFNWSREDIPMLIAEVEHKRWKKALYAYLEDRSGSLMAPEGDHRHCCFGGWYYSPRSKVYAAFERFAAIETLHVRMHELGRALVRLRESGDIAAMEALKQQLEAASALLSEAVEQIQLDALIAMRSRKG